MTAVWRWTKRIVLILFVLGLLTFVVLYIRSWFLVREFETYTPPTAAVILDRNGEIIDTLGGGEADYIPLAEMPLSLRQAVVAVEDKRFYRHFGLDPIRIVGALIADIKAGAKVQGASTITQQLAKNAFLTPEKTIRRKIEEAVLAIVLEQRYSKDKILELYLNYVDFGQGAIGVENAAQIYFGKPARELSLSESALLAGLLRAPSAYNPFANLEKAKARRDLVLELMAEQEMITPSQLETAQAEEIVLSARRGGKAPYFADYIENLLLERYGNQTVYGAGLRIHTTLDLRLQTIAQEIFQEQDYQGALVALNPKTGEILAMVGGRDYSKSQFNRATSALRQPGSAFKPFVYVTALMQGYQPNHLLHDYPQNFSGYQPTNFGEKYWGPVTMKHALAKSLNVASVWLLEQVGIGNVINLLKRLGITTLVDDTNIEPNDWNLSLALGGLTRGVSPLELAGAFTPFANEGVYSRPIAITRIIDANGNVLLNASPRQERIFSEQIAFLITDMMQGTLEYGTAASLGFDRPAAGKTGSTNDQSDAWFVGYTPSLLTVVYIGHDQPAPLGGYGSSLAGPIWVEFMRQALAEQPPEDFIVPVGVTDDVPIHIFTGVLGDPACEWVIPHALLTGTEPTQFYDCTTGEIVEAPPSKLPRSLAEDLLENIQ